MALNSLSPTYQWWNLCQILRSQIEQMHSAICFFPLLALITIILLLLALFLLISSQTSQKKKRTNAFIYGQVSTGSIRQMRHISRETQFTPRIPSICVRIWEGPQIPTDWGALHVWTQDCLPDYGPVWDLDSWLISHHWAMEVSYSPTSLSHAEWKIYWVMAISIVLWSQGPKEDIRQ